MIVLSLSFSLNSTLIEEEDSSLHDPLKSKNLKHAFELTKVFVVPEVLVFAFIIQELLCSGKLLVSSIGRALTLWLSNFY